MPVAHGTIIDAATLEREVSTRFTLRDFVCLCNVVLWASSRSESTLPPQFSEQVYAPDGGEDAEWHGELPDDSGFRSGLLSPGLNVMQYKFRDTSAQDRRRIAANLRQGLAGALSVFKERTGMDPKQYMLITNVDLSLARKKSLEAAIRKGYPQSDVKVVVLGAADLAGFANDLPHIRSAFFASSKFMTWETGWRTHTELSHAALVGRQDDLGSLAALLDNPNCRFLVISGQPGIGKSRLAYEITRLRCVDTVIATDPLVLRPSDILELEPTVRDAVVVAFDPPLELLNGLEVLLDRKHVKIVATYSSVPSALTMHGDPRISCYTVRPLPEQDSRRLLESLNPNMDFGLTSLVVHQSGGNPGILLAASRYGMDLRREPSAFIRSVSGSYEELARRLLTPSELAVLSALSLFSRVDVFHPDDLEQLSQVFGIPRRVIFSALDRLHSCAFIKRSGSYVEVVPAVFAAYLARKAATGDDLWSLFSALGRSGRARLATRLGELGEGEVDSFWSRVFTEGGPLADLSTALMHAYLLPIAAGARPDATAERCVVWLQNLSTEERHSICGVGAHAVCR